MLPTSACHYTQIYLHSTLTLWARVLSKIKIDAIGAVDLAAYVAIYLPLTIRS